MTPHKLHVAPGLTLDADYVAGGTFALLAKKGAGKSYAARVMAEEMFEAKIPFVLIDPMGTSWGLRAGADGTQGGGLPIPIFGGNPKYADAPLERTGGSLIADLVVEEGLSMIIDLSAFGTRAAERQFAHDFFDRLYRTNRELVHLFVDEADLFAPQKPQPGDAPLLGITENIVRRGRNKGIGITLITQRPAVLNKDVLTQVDALVAMRITGLQDRNAIDAWVMGHGDQEAAAKVKGTLAGLANGEGWWWIPELDVLKRVTVRKSRTFDSSPTKTTKGSQREPKSLADIDMGAIETKMAATIERAKADDPRELRRRITELERQLAAGARAFAAQREVTEPQTIEVPVEVSVLTDEDRQLLKTYQTLGEISKEIWLRDAAELGRLIIRVEDALLARPRSEPAPPPVREKPARVVTPPLPLSPASNGDSDTVLGRGERKVLEVLAEFPEGRTQNEVAFLAGYSAKASTIGVILSKLRKADLVEQGQPIRPTPAGLEAAGGVRELPRGDALLQRWLAHPRMGEGERKVLLALVDLYPEVPSNETLCEITGYSPIASTMGVILSKLRKLGLVEKGVRRLAPEFSEAIEVP